MRIFYSEYMRDYSHYTFGYGVYCRMDDRKEMPQIYQHGFLPYSANLLLTDSIFYLCRSLRVNLANYQASSENRRTDRKLELLQPQMEQLPIAAIRDDSTFRAFCMAYAAERFKHNAMNAERLNYILHHPVASHILAFSYDGKPLGYVLVGIEAALLHYWFAFFDSQLMESYPVGKWLMWKVVDWSKANQLEYVYLGTCYGANSLYKVRDFKGLEYFDGAGWNTDMDRLKAWCKTDEDPVERDRFKTDGKVPES
ncbi:MAG: GNAT family N-acetyltransferase [Saprospiraceae bacterium]